MARSARPARRVAALILLALAAASPLVAQEMASGTWTGSILAPDGIEYPVEFEVSGEGEGVVVTMLIPEIGETVPLEDIALEEDALSFTFFPGLLVSCTLAWQEEGEYAGECIGEDGQAGVLTMVPPDDGGGLH